MRNAVRWMMGLIAVAALALPGIVRAEEGLIAGIDLGAAIPQGKTKDRMDTGGTFTPYVGYMFNDIIGLMGQAQVLGFPNKDRPGILDEDATWSFGAHAGPRIAIPFTIGGLGLEPYGTYQAGVFTGLNGNTPLTHTSWGYSTGGGLNFRLTDSLLLGGWARYNNVDQRVEPGPGPNVEFVTAGIGVMYNMRPEEKPAPAPVVAQAPPPPPPPVKKKIVLRGVNFDFDKANIRADAKPILDEAISTLKKEGNISIVAEGHTDSRGTDAYNQKLSERRAVAVKDYLVKGGISSSRIEAVGKGESQPVASNDTEEGRAENRRVELRIR